MTTPSARSPMFAALARALRLARVAVRDGSDARSVVARAQEERYLLGRRSAVQGAAVAGLALGAAACSAPASADDATADTTDALKKKRARVVIVGAGLAGLSAAHRLAKRGYVPRVFDANNRIGGRTFTARGLFAAKAELGGELIDTGHKDIKGLVTEIGLSLADAGGATEGLEAERYFIGGVSVPEADVVAAFTPIAKKLDQAWKAQGKDYVTYDAFTPEAQRLDRMSIAEWLDRHEVSGMIRTLLDTAYTCEYGREIQEQSFLNMLYLIGRDPDPFLVFGESDERFTVREGNDAIAKTIVEGLPREVTLNHALVAVRPRPDGTLTVVFEHGRSVVEEIADRLVLAIPFSQLRKCDLRALALPAAKKLSIDTVAYGTNAKLMIGTSSRPWALAGAAGTSFSDAVFNECWDSTRSFATPKGVLTSFTGGLKGVAMGQGSVQQKALAFAAHAERIFPGTRAAYDGTAVRFHWSSARFFEGSYACYRPGEWTTFVGSEAEAVGNVHFAGEHTSTDYQGFMEGAVESGFRVAKEIREALG